MKSGLIWGCLILLCNFILTVEGAACRSLHSVVHPCLEEKKTGDVVYLDTSNTYSMKGSCLCYIDVNGTSLDVTISVESGPDQCESVLNFTTLNYSISCGKMPPPLSTSISKTVYISWTKKQVYKNTDACVKIEKSNQSQGGNLSLVCEKGGEFAQTTGDTQLVWLFSRPTNTLQTTLPTPESDATKKKLASIFESNLVVGILSGIVLFLFLLGLIVHCDERQIKAKEAKERELAEQRRLAKIQAIQRMHPPRRKEVVETKL